MNIAGVAAMLGLAVFAGSMIPQRPAPTGGLASQGGSAIPAGYHKVDSSEDAAALYLQTGREEGRVIQEIPSRRVVRRVPLADGTEEVFFERRFLERAVVQPVYDVARDDTGEPVIRQTSQSVPVSY